MNIVEYGRKLSIESLFNTNVFSNSFNFWKNRIQNILKLFRFRRIFIGYF